LRTRRNNFEPTAIAGVDRNGRKTRENITKKKGNVQSRRTTTKIGRGEWKSRDARKRSGGEEGDLRRLKIRPTYEL